MVTYLAIGFVVILIAAIFYGFSIVLRSHPDRSKAQTASCFLCKKAFNLTQLAEREIGDSKVIYFCPDCVKNLYDDMARIKTSFSHFV